MKNLTIILPIYYGNLPDLECSINKQIIYFRKHLNDYNWKIIIALNGQKEEKVWTKIQELCQKYSEVDFYYTQNQGKGYGVVGALMEFKSDINTFMDIDLATDLVSFVPMIKQLEKGYDLVIGSRYHKNSRIKRSWKRYIISKTYHTFLTKLIMGLKVRDAQCGFKAMNKKFVEQIIPLVQDKDWFFETEFVYLAQKRGYNVKEIPVIWIENDISGVPLFKTAIAFLNKAILLRLNNSWG